MRDFHDLFRDDFVHDMGLPSIAHGLTDAIERLPHHTGNLWIEYGMLKHAALLIQAGALERLSATDADQSHCLPVMSALNHTYVIIFKKFGTILYLHVNSAERSDCDGADQPEPEDGDVGLCSRAWSRATRWSVRPGVPRLCPGLNPLIVW